MQYNKRLMGNGARLATKVYDGSATMHVFKMYSINEATQNAFQIRVFGLARILRNH